ncbi:MAG: amidohydrolase [Candidatus Koribacter versatilis]|uniref:Amidohydrolase n=1 Tax=Candidatus Korobacter versatilis TaxID=658062 RepID=A0A932EPW7_9BACT|nr:amidohydrolase [Candidatus Koribacter versatilis]
MKLCRLLPLVFLAASLFAQRPAADTIITNAKVYTVEKEHPRAEAIAILRERIVGVGSAAEIDAWRGPETKVIDAHGHLLLPGFNDAHTHFVDGGVQLDSVELKDAPSPEEFAKRIGERAQQRPGEWIVGGDWDDQRWTPAQLPTRQMIDAVTGSTPVFVGRYDGHMSLANSAALRLAKVTAKTPDPPGGAIVHDAQGNPTGVLKDAAMNLVWKVMPGLTHDQRAAAIKRALAYAASLGVTSVQHMNPSYDDVRAYMEFAERGELTARIYAAPMETGWQDQAKLGVQRAFGSSYLRLGALKGYADGSLGSTTAYFFAPYTDAPNTRGLLADEMHPITAMRGRLMKADDAGLQLCIHAIGDNAISIILDIFSDIVSANGARDRRLRIEHAQHMAAKDFKRFAELGVIASVQPYHAIDDGRWAEKRIGPERIKTTYAFRTFLDNGVRLAFGTDWTVAPLDPLQTIYAAVTRATLDGKNPDGWVPEQKLTVAEAVEAYTAGSAYAEFQEKEKGTIAAGKLADVVLLSDDIFSIRPEAIKDVKVDLTIVGGRVVFERK